MSAILSIDDMKFATLSDIASTYMPGTIKESSDEVYSYTFETDTSSLAVMQVKYLRTRDEILMVSQN